MSELLHQLLLLDRAAISGEVCGFDVSDLVNVVAIILNVILGIVVLEEWQDGASGLFDRLKIVLDDIETSWVEDVGDLGFVPRFASTQTFAIFSEDERIVFPAWTIAIFVTSWLVVKLVLRIYLVAVRVTLKYAFLRFFLVHEVFFIEPQSLFSIDVAGTVAVTKANNPCVA